MTEHGSRLDPWRGSYAQRTPGMTASEIRALFAVASRPEVVSLAGGMPYLSALPLDVVAETVQRLLSRRGRQALQYGSGQGDAGLREQILEVMAAGGHRTPTPTTSSSPPGSQQALDLVTRIFIDPGDVVLAEAPSYVGRARRRSRPTRPSRARGDGRRRPGPRGARGGASPRSSAAGQAGQVPLHRPDLPQPGRRHAHGPRGDRRSSRSRGGTASSCSRTTPTACWASTASRPARDARHRRTASSTSGSFSKTFAAGLRVGWAVAPHARAREARARQRVGDPVPVAYTQLDRLDLPGDRAAGCDQIKIFRELYRERRDAPARVARRDCCRRARPGPAPTAASTLGHPARGARRQGDAAARGHRAGRLRARHRLLRRRPPGTEHRCGCRTAIPTPTGSARASAGSPASCEQSSS